MRDALRGSFGFIDITTSGNVAAEIKRLEAADILCMKQAAYGTVTAVVEKQSLLRSQRIAVTENILMVVVLILQFVSYRGRSYCRDFQLL